MQMVMKTDSVIIKVE